ncbi:hypothetical protein N7540_011238 [Penicillium herquei]|nr:hypothetical protein N7540_011238 [Penicillium herquei]
MGRLVDKRPVRVANCSGYCGDPYYEMRRQASLGDVDFITGDYLAEVNLANNAEAYRAGNHSGYEASAWDGLKDTMDLIAERGIRVVINGGALNPRGLAVKVEALSAEKGYNLKVAYLSGDDVYDKFGPFMPTTDTKLKHFDCANSSVQPSKLARAFEHPTNGKPIPMISAHAYLGARGIVQGLREGADIVICGRVSDASPVIAASWFWHDWSETDYDNLAGSLIAGHLIECSAYVTGANFSGFDKYPIESLVLPGFPIAEIQNDGSCVITKHANTQGMVNVDTVRCQFLYELQGDIYLNSDVKAHTDSIEITQIGKDRVHVMGIKGSAPPPTTKLAVFYPGGYQSEILLNATGYATSEKWDLVERQLKALLTEEARSALQTLQFQRIGTPAINPENQNESTTYLRIFIAADTKEYVINVVKAFSQVSLKHFSGLHASLTSNSYAASPRSVLAYYPALIEQSELDEEIHFIKDGVIIDSFKTGNPPQFSPMEPRKNFDPANGAGSSGPTHKVRLGDIVLARSGDKGGNLNFGLFVTDSSRWEWLRSYMTRGRMQALLGSDWQSSFFIERVEFPKIQAVHFVIYGILGRGVSSSNRLDGFGKGFADYIRDKIVDVPIALL